MNEPRTVTIQLAPEWVALIEAIAKLQGKSFEDCANEFINRLLKRAGPALFKQD